jgi:hypothetical protein
MDKAQPMRTKPAVIAVGDVFGKLTVLGVAERRSTTMWLAVCECGNERIVRASRFNDKTCPATSCVSCAGRRGTEKNTSHGHYEGGGKSPTAYSWMAMKERCLNPRHMAYHRYGGRGVYICDGWLNRFEQFLADMGERPKGTTLDRKDNDGDYTCGHCSDCYMWSAPANCRWATSGQQTTNRCTTVLISARGRKQSISAWARELGRGASTLRHRLFVQRLDHEDALFGPIVEYANAHRGSLN